MPTYTFKLSNDDGCLADNTGVNLPDAEAAYSYAQDVVHELMKGRELNTRPWQLSVYENDTEIFEIPFASVDETLDILHHVRGAGQRRHRTWPDNPSGSGDAGRGRKDELTRRGVRNRTA